MAVFHPGAEACMFEVVQSGARDAAGTESHPIPTRAPGLCRPSAGRLEARYSFSRILGASEAMRNAVEHARIATRNSLPVVLFGESGTGKELFAHAIHAASARRDGPFVPVNCGSIPSELIEAEFFGYEGGTFTGGRREGKRGRFEDADGGTLFLDEVTELSPQAQTALLRVLQEKEVVRVGGSTVRSVNVRVIAATNMPLEGEVEARHFRRDLYYRLKVLPISIPPLRERGDDMVLLAETFLAEAEREVGRRGLSLSDSARTALCRHRWPGNVRELNNVILRSAAMAPHPRLDAGDLLIEETAPEPSAPPDEHPQIEKTIRDGRDALLQLLEECHWNFVRAARQLGISRMTLYRRLRTSGISRQARPRS